ncbi:hypothetical protein [Allorhizocola rhizosphaerae]|uniref:hypothetical protein n=1 Tax=Allorhizocola rhizosphaerae TaxID=1872709 RepID=UPI000E3CE5F0|nr:hypothetical protein [Allorhizocola rhizosphaerae]
MRSILRRGVTRSFILSLALLATPLIVPATPAHAAWAAPVPLNMQIIGYTPGGGQLTLGRVQGTLQLDDGGNALRYDVLMCRQSSYQLPYMTIDVNVYYAGGRRYATRIGSVYPTYGSWSSEQPCYGNRATVSAELSYAGFSNVEFIVYGSTFVGQSHTIFTEDAIYYNPY